MVSEYHLKPDNVLTIIWITDLYNGNQRNYSAPEQDTLAFCHWIPCKEKLVQRHVGIEVPRTLIYMARRGRSLEGHGRQRELSDPLTFLKLPSGHSCINQQDVTIIYRPWIVLKGRTKETIQKTTTTKKKCDIHVWYACLQCSIMQVKNVHDSTVNKSNSMGHLNKKYLLSHTSSISST